MVSRHWAWLCPEDEGCSSLWAGEGVSAPQEWCQEESTGEKKAGENTIPKQAIWVTTGTLLQSLNEGEDGEGKDKRFWVNGIAAIKVHHIIV